MTSIAEPVRLASPAPGRQASRLPGTADDYRDTIAARRTFAARSLNGYRWPDDGPASLRWLAAPVTGDLPPQYHGLLAGADYVIFSYRTPIAWHVAGIWWLPRVTYSLTTTMHQEHVFCAIQKLPEVLDGTAQVRSLPHVSLMKGYGQGGRYGPREGGW